MESFTAILQNAKQKNCGREILIMIICQMKYFQIYCHVDYKVEIRVVISKILKAFR